MALPLFIKRVSNSDNLTQMKVPSKVNFFTAAPIGPHEKSVHPEKSRANRCVKPEPMMVKCHSAESMGKGTRICTSCGTAYTSKKQVIVSTLAPACQRCEATGIIRSNRDEKLLDVYCRVVEFYRNVMNIIFSPELLSNVVSKSSWTPYSVIDAIPVEVVGYHSMNFGGPARKLHQLGRCECRAAVMRSSKKEVNRWVHRIVVSRGLTYEALGGVIAHELMHAYIWLMKSENKKSLMEDETSCDMASTMYLHREAKLLSVKISTDNSESQALFRQRLIVCQWRIQKAEECQNETAP